MFKSLFLSFFIFSGTCFSQDFLDKNFYLVDSIDLNAISSESKHNLDSLLIEFHAAETDTAKITQLQDLIISIDNHAVAISYCLYRNEMIRNLGTRYSEDYRFLEWAYGYSELGYQYAMTDQYLNSLQAYRIAFDYSGSIDRLDLKSKCASGMAFNVGRLGYLDSVKFYYKLAAEISLESGDPDAIVRSYRGVGYAYHKLGQLDSAIYYYNYSLDAAIEHEKISSVADNLYSIGALYAQRDENEPALKYLFESVDIYKKLESEYNECQSLLMIGNIYQTSGEMKRASKIYDQAEELALHSETPRLKADTYEKIGDFYLATDQPELAYDYFNKAMTIAEEIDYAIAIVSIYTNLGRTLCAMDSISQGIGYLEKAYELNQTVSDYNLECLINLELGTQYIELGQLQKSESFLLKSFEMSSQVGLKEYAWQSAKALAENYKSGRLWKDAYFYLESAFMWRDSMNTDANYKALYEQEYLFLAAADSMENARVLIEKDLVLAQSKLELEKRSNLVNLLIFTILSVGILVLMMVLILRSRNIRRHLEYERHSNQLRQQVLRTQMNPHFLFNSLNSIQAIYTEGNTNAANDYLADFGTLLRKILENSEKEKITLSEEVEMLELYLSLEKLRTKGKIDYSIQVSDVIRSDEEFMTPMLIQPLVENAIWHGVFPTKKDGIVKIIIEKTENGKLKCSVEDNGVGMNGQNKHELHNSKGISIIKERIGEGHSLIFETPENGGTRAILTTEILNYV